MAHALPAHPILGATRPHLAVHCATPTGTLIRPVADAWWLIVLESGRRVNPHGETFIPGESIPTSRRKDLREHVGTLVERLGADAPF